MPELVDKSIKAGLTLDLWPKGVTRTECTLLFENKTNKTKWAKEGNGGWPGTGHHAVRDSDK